MSEPTQDSGKPRNQNARRTWITGRVQRLIVMWNEGIVGKDIALAQGYSSERSVHAIVSSLRRRGIDVRRGGKISRLRTRPPAAAAVAMRGDGSKSPRHDSASGGFVTATAHKLTYMGDNPRHAECVGAALEARR
jgi:hypothetical protein